MTTSNLLSEDEKINALVDNMYGKYVIDNTYASRDGKIKKQDAKQAIKTLLVEARINEHRKILDMTEASHEYEQNEQGSGIQFFDNLRLERMNELTQLSLPQEEQ